MAAIVALFGAIGAMVGGQTGMLLALLFGGAMNVFAYWYSDKMVLKMYRRARLTRLGAAVLRHGSRARATGRATDAESVSDR
jgi:heat shock protein HtpX